MSSACCVYAIVRRDTPLPSPRVEPHARGLSLVPCRDLAAVTGRMTDAAAPAGVNAVLRHEAVVEAVCRQGRALPVRFGTVFRDPSDVASAIAGRYESLAADLLRLGDKVELSLTALWASPPGDTPAVATRDVRGGGAGYLRARAAEHHHADALRERARAAARTLDQSLGALALERRRWLLPTPGTAWRATYLLDAGAVGAFRQAFDLARGTLAGVRVLLTGPWPPYSFVQNNERMDVASPHGALATLVQLMTEGRPG